MCDRTVIDRHDRYHTWGTEEVHESFRFAIAFTLYHVIISLINTADSLTMWHGKILTLDIL